MLATYRSGSHEAPANYFSQKEKQDKIIIDNLYPNINYINSNIYNKQNPEEAKNGRYANKRKSISMDLSNNHVKLQP